MKHFLVVVLFALSMNVSAQELFVVTEPASNMPTGSIGLRLGQFLMKEKFKPGNNYHLMPEIMWGANKNLMLHAAAFISNRNKSLVTEGGSVYAKYRFLSKDDLHQHFRIPARSPCRNYATTRPCFSASARCGGCGHGRRRGLWRCCVLLLDGSDHKSIPSRRRPV